MDNTNNDGLDDLEVEGADDIKGGATTTPPQRITKTALVGDATSKTPPPGAKLTPPA
jgi:hypothetical protein